MGDIADDHAMRLYDLDDDYTDRGREPVTVVYRKLMRTTEKAWCLLLGDGRAEWFPKSQCTLDREEKILLVPEWLAYEKEVI